jgi:drug/metabolite transporter (DMT)-like permease
VAAAAAIARTAAAMEKLELPDTSDLTRAPQATRWVDQVRLLALSGAAAIAFSSTLVRLSKASPTTAAIFRCAYALPILAFLAYREDRRFGARTWRERRPALISGVFFAADLILWHTSIEDVGAGLATVLANAQVVVLPLLAWVLRSEFPGWRLFAGIPVAACGVLLISGVIGEHAYGRDPTAGAIYGVGAGIAYAGFLFLLREGGGDLRRTAGGLCDATVVATVTAIAAGLVIGNADLVPTWPGAGWLIVLALTSQVIGWLLIARSLPRAPAALVALLLTFQPIGSVAIAALVLGESPSGLQLLGVAIVAVALLGATLGRQPRLPVASDPA